MDNVGGGPSQRGGCLALAQIEGTILVISYAVKG